ncbi:MAG: hypothetical protein RI936_31 [Pseudomonadota bacterium]|jgi:hypothetical protein
MTRKPLPDTAASLVPRRADDDALATDLSCKAAAGDDLAALGVTLMDRILGTRGAGREVCLVEHDTIRRLLTAAGYGAKP